jgi:hypothetical protein
VFGTVADLEGDSLNPTKIHVLAATSSETDEPRATADYGKMVEFWENQEVIVGHNFARFDVPVSERILGIEVPKETLIVDTLALSWYLYPNRHKEKFPDGTKKNHGLESWGKEFGIEKPEVDDWENLTYEEYRHRCVEDVKINRILWLKMYKYLKALYGSHEEIVRFLRYLAFKMDCAREQERSGWRLDVEKCRANIERLEPLYDQKIDELRAAMPRVPVTKSVKKPSKPFKQDGTLSEAGKRWFKLLESRGLPPEYGGTVEIITGYDEPNPGSTDQIKKWLFELGWKPRTFKENKKGVEIPQINKLKQDGGGVCDSVKELYEIEPKLEALDGVYVLQHRLGILRGFLSAVDDDGFLRAKIAGLTNTLRFKHSEIVNLPKVDAAYGEEVRGCLIARDGYELCGSDMSSLEDRTKQHYMWKYDPDYVREMMTDDFDPHLDIAVIAKLMTKVDADWYKKFQPAIASKDEHIRYKLLKTIRGIAKNTNYAGVYGAGPPKIAKTAGISLAQAQEIHKAYWERNWSVKAVAQSCRTKTVGGQQWLFNPVSEFWYSLRHDKDRFSTLNQGTGVYCFDTWLGFVRRERPQLTGQFHDEIILEVRKGFREEVKEFLKKCIQKTNDLLQLNRELDIGIDFGDSYAQIH